MDVMFLPTR